jgi:beta-lactamase class A
VGVYALDPASGKDLAHRADERFAMCSTFKWVLAATVLERVDRGELALSQTVSYDAGDVLEYAPATRAHLAEGSMTVAALAEAAVSVSDNTAANLLLDLVGGTAGFTSFVRRLGDEVTRLDRNEPTLNTNLPGDGRDTTSPRAMVGLLGRIVLGDLLSSASRERLIAWLLGCKTCDQRLRAGFPPGWRVADKTGSGNRGAINDVGVAWPPSGSPLVIAAYLSGSDASLETLSAAHAQIARIVSRALRSA